MRSRKQEPTRREAGSQSQESRTPYCRMIRSLLLTILFAAASSVAGAQTESVLVEHRNNCRLEVQTLESGHPGPKTTWAIGIIPTCVEEGGAAALASAVRGLRASTDTATLHLLRRQAGRFRDADVFAALTEVVGDPAASAPARVYALLAIGSIIYPNERTTFADATTDLDAEGRPRCNRQTTYITDYHQVQGPPLPADFQMRVDELLRRIRADSSTPPMVMAATNCGY